MLRTTLLEPHLPQWLLMAAVATISVRADPWSSCGSAWVCDRRRAVAVVVRVTVVWWRLFMSLLQVPLCRPSLPQRRRRRLRLASVVRVLVCLPSAGHLRLSRRRARHQCPLMASAQESSRVPCLQRRLQRRRSNNLEAASLCSLLHPPRHHGPSLHPFVALLLQLLLVVPWRQLAVQALALAASCQSPSVVVHLKASSAPQSLWGLALVWVRVLVLAVVLVVACRWLAVQVVWLELLGLVVSSLLVRCWVAQLASTPVVVVVLVLVVVLLVVAQALSQVCPSVLWWVVVLLLPLVVAQVLRLLTVVVVPPSWLQWHRPLPLPRLLLASASPVALEAGLRLQSVCSPSTVQSLSAACSTPYNKSHRCGRQAPTV